MNYDIEHKYLLLTVLFLFSPGQGLTQEFNNIGLHDEVTQPTTPSQVEISKKAVRF